MATYRLTTLIAAKPERVFDAWIDLDLMPHWIEGLSRISDVTGPLDRPGTRYKAWFGRYGSEIEVLDAERPRYFRSRLGGWLKGTNEALFVPDGSGTRIEQAFTTEGLLPSTLGWIWSHGTYRGSFKGELETFRRLVEARES